MKKIVITTETKETFATLGWANTLQIRRPFGGTLLLSLLFFGLFFFGGEFLAETKKFQSFFVQQTWDGRHKEFERQLARLDAVYNQEGRIDCIFLGNSMVWRGFEPVAFNAGYQSQSGEEMRCFNFGVDGMPASMAGAIARILVEDYHPRILLFGIDARDLAVPTTYDDHRSLAEMDWLRYRMGEPSLKGWFIEHSNLYRYRVAIQRLLHFDYQGIQRGDRNSDLASRFGYDLELDVGDVTIPPDPLDADGSEQYYFRLLADYQIHAEDVTGFEQVLKQKSNLEHLLVVELPVPETYYAFFGNQRSDYERFVSEVGRISAAQGVQFILTDTWQVIPLEGWVDYSHLNLRGARAFSQRLGVEVAKILHEEKSNQRGARVD